MSFEGLGEDWYFILLSLHFTGREKTRQQNGVPYTTDRKPAHLFIFSRSHMSKRRMGDTARTNGTDSVPRPFVIGVAGGTASGKVYHQIMWPN